MSNPDYYCNQKFWWLSVNLQRKNISSCCAAEPQTVDLQWLKQNPSKLFNTPKLIQERGDMLNGIRVESCESVCWAAEDRHAVSRRIKTNGDNRTHISVVSSPETVNIILSADCNMTCVYCCKQFSSAWYKDIKSNGPYLDDNRYKIESQDQIIEILGQKTLKDSRITDTLLSSIYQIENLKSISISGGEPFLYNGLEDITNGFTVPVEIYTGLGVNPQRFSKILDKLKTNVSLVISGESTDKFYEFNRYGNSYQNFLLNIESIKKRNIPYRFSITLTNLTIFGYQKFEELFGNDNNIVQFCNDPNYLAVGVIDPISIDQLKLINYKWDNTAIKASLDSGYSKQQKLNLALYLKEFANRRSISLDIFPKSFIDWINKS